MSNHFGTISIKRLNEVFSDQTATPKNMWGVLFSKNKEFIFLEISH